MGEEENMTSEQFVYWLQGFSELSGKPPTGEQWAAIQDHLKLVFDKKTPEYPWTIDRTTPITFPYEVTCSAGKRNNGNNRRKL